MRDANGKLERWVSISLDMDERKRAEEERRGKEEVFRKIADGGTRMYLHHVARWGDGLRE
jgi:hypothetical protein